MTEASGVIDTSLTPNQDHGTVAHPLVDPQSSISLTMERHSAETVDISAMSAKVVGPVGMGSFDWELTPFIGHDNPVKIHYSIRTP